MTTATIPLLPRGVRTHHDRVRERQVLLGPERALMLDDIGAAVLAEVDGRRSIAEISLALATRYDAPLADVQTDVAEFLGGLADMRLVDFRDA